MKLYGSVPSPFVRRIRMVLDGADYDFEAIDIFDPEIRAFLRKHNPTLKVPMLFDEETVIYDSGVIFEYLAQKFGLKELTWNERNLVTVINAANDSLVNLLILKRSGFDVDEDKLYFNIQRERLEESFAVLNQKCESGTFDDWRYPAICLYCLLDWADFRELYVFEKFASLHRFWLSHSEDDIAKSTNPRN